MGLMVSDMIRPTILSIRFEHVKKNRHLFTALLFYKTVYKYTNYLEELLLVVQQKHRIMNKNIDYWNKYF